MRRTVLDIPKMDCPSEERLVRAALQRDGIARLDFDLEHRRLVVMHEAEADRLLEWLAPLRFGARISQTGPAGASDVPATEDPAAAGRERGTLEVLLGINAAMFVVELAAGWMAQSAGLIADSLDMFADAAVYGISLYAVGHAARRQATAARVSGFLQLLLATGALLEVLRRWVFGSQPEPLGMAGIALLALAANVACMALIAKHRHGGVHMKASWIFSTNDVLANLGVILAGGLVAWTGAAWPDLAIGTAIALVVLSGALRILGLARASAASGSTASAPD